MGGIQGVWEGKMHFERANSFKCYGELSKVKCEKYPLNGVTGQSLVTLQRTVSVNSPSSSQSAVG